MTYWEWREKKWVITPAAHNKYLQLFFCLAGHHLENTQQTHGGTHKKSKKEIKKKELTLSLRETINRSTIPCFISAESPLNLCSIFLQFLCCCLIHILSSADLSLAGFLVQTSIWIQVFDWLCTLRRSTAGWDEQCLEKKPSVNLQSS